MINAGKRLSIASWNIAAINNNPFEYWITYKDNPHYEEIMAKVEQFLEDPGEKDVPVSTVFTDTMFNKLDERLQGVGWTSVKKYWEDDFKNRKIVEGFMKVSLFITKYFVSIDILLGRKGVSSANCRASVESLVGRSPWIQATGIHARSCHKYHLCGR